MRDLTNDSIQELRKIAKEMTDLVKKQPEISAFVKKFIGQAKIADPIREPYKGPFKGSVNETEEEDPLYVEYSRQMPSEEPFMLGGQKFEYVMAKYPNGKEDIGVYAFAGDVVYGYNAFRKMHNINENALKLSNLFKRKV